VIVNVQPVGVVPVDALCAVTVKVSGLGPLAPVSVTFAALDPPGHATAALNCDPTGSCVTVTCCEPGTETVAPPPNAIGPVAGLTSCTTP